MRPETYATASGIAVTRTISPVPYRRGLKALLRKMDTQRGIYLSSGYEFPGRYSRWDVGAVAPPLEIVAQGRDIAIRPLNERGQILNQILQPVLAAHPHWERFAEEGGTLLGKLKPLPALFPEEERSKQPSAFSVVRALIARIQASPCERASRWSAPSATICCCNSIPSNANCRAQTQRTCTCSCATTSTSWIARRSASSATSSISRAAIYPPRAGPAPPAS